MGRIDKKFCSDACRNAYNNKQNKDQTNLMRNINNKLRKNFKILSEQNFVENNTSNDFQYQKYCIIFSNCPIPTPQDSTNAI